MDLSIPLLIFVIVAAAIAGRAGKTQVRLPWLTIAACILLAACFIAQVDVPNLFSQVERNGWAIRTGQGYRLFTALWFQDGGIGGGAFNIATLAILGSLAEQVLDKTEWLSIYLVGALSTEIVALSWQPTGAGNSIGYMSLAGALLALALCQRANGPTKIVAVLGLGAGVLLCLVKDIHGAATLIGCAVLLMARWTGPKNVTS